MNNITEHCYIVKRKLKNKLNEIANVEKVCFGSISSDSKKMLYLICKIDSNVKKEGMFMMVKPSMIN